MSMAALGQFESRSSPSELRWSKISTATRIRDRPTSETSVTAATSAASLSARLVHTWWRNQWQALRNGSIPSAGKAFVTAPRGRAAKSEPTAVVAPLREMSMQTW